MDLHRVESMVRPLSYLPCRAGAPPYLQARSQEEPVSRFVEVEHDVWVAASPDVVRTRHLDLNHRKVALVHPRERLRQLAPGPGGPRYERIVRTGWRMTCDVYERVLRADGSVVDTCVAGPHRGRAIGVRFWRRSEDGRVGTLVEMTLSQPLQPLVGRLMAAWIRRRMAEELREFAAQSKADVERGDKTGRHLRVA